MLRVAVGDGLALDVRVDGPRAGRPVLLLHGFPQHGGMWDAVAARLADRGFRTAAPDQRGYAPTARPVGVAGYRLDRLVADAVAVADSLGPGPVDLVGHDWGAAVAWAVAARCPGRVRSLTAVSVPHPRAFARALLTDADQRRRSAYITLFRQEGRAEQALLADDGRALRQALAEAGLPPTDIDRYVPPMLEPGALTGALRWYRAVGPVALARIGTVRVPTTFVWGAADVAIGPGGAVRCGRYVHAAYRFEPLAGVSHWVADEVPDVLADLVLHRLGQS